MKKHLIFIIACICVCLLPLIGMAVHPTTTSTENKVMSSFPSLKAKDGSLNLDFFQEFEKYFNEHFAFRNELVYADAKIQTSLFSVSNVDTVTYGTDDWLYYTSTLGDYLGSNRMSDRQIYNLAHNISLVKEYVEGKGSDFLLTIPPNKNTLYGEHMPYYNSYIVDHTHNVDLLTPKLQELNIPYADLLELFRNENEVLYLKRDSHWNMKGAVLAYQCIMNALEYPYMDYTDLPVTRAKNEDGDLNRMLYTFYGEKELNYNYEIDQKHTYVNDAKSVEDGWIETEGGTGNGTLLMFRDSFGNTLIPLIADQFEKAYFTKEVPYGLESLMEQYDPDAVVLEKVERNLSEYINMPPIISPVEETENVLKASKAITAKDTTQAAESAATISMASLDYDFNYYTISGSIEESLLEDETDIIVRINGKYYNAYHIDSNDYEVYIKKENITAYPVEIEILTKNLNDYRVVQTKKINEGELLP